MGATLSGFRRDEVVRESLRGVVARRGGSSLIVLAAVLVGAATTGWGWAEASAAHSSWVAAHLAGVDTFSVRATSAYPLDSSQCDALRQVTGVESAGAVIRTEAIGTVQAPTSKTTVVVGTPGLGLLAYPADKVSNASVVAGRDLADGLAIVPSSNVTIVRGQAMIEVIQVHAVSRHAARIPGLENALLVASGEPQPVSECLVTALPGARATVELVLHGWFDTPNISVIDYLPADELRLDPESQLQHRPSAFSPLIGAALLSVLLLGSIWSRRQEAALYRLLGLRWPGLLILHTSEVAILVLMPCAAAVLAVVLVTSGAVLPASVGNAMIRDIVGLLVSLSVLPLLATGLSAYASPIDVFKGR